jgi:hypothetical protein
VGVGALFGAVAAVGSVATSHSVVYASASTQVLVDSPTSALANASVDLTGYQDRAAIFARIMTTTAALQYIGKAAGINGNLIDATGPVEINQSPTVTHAPVDVVNGQDVAAPAVYKLSFVQNPSLPTVDVYADAPTTAQAIALANGVATGFANFVNSVGASNVPQAQRIQIRQLGPATGGMVDASASKSMALLAFVGVFGLWCGIVLFATRLRANLRAAKRGDVDDALTAAEEQFPAVPTPAYANHLPLVAQRADASATEMNANGAVNGKSLHRAWVTTRIQSRP